MSTEALLAQMQTAPVVAASLAVVPSSTTTAVAAAASTPATKENNNNDENNNEILGGGGNDASSDGSKSSNSTPNSKSPSAKSPEKGKWEQALTDLYALVFFPFLDKTRGADQILIEKFDMSPQQAETFLEKWAFKRNEFVKNSSRVWFPPVVRVQCKVEVSAGKEQSTEVSEAMRGLLKNKSPLEIMSDNWFVSYMEDGPKKKTLMTDASFHILLSTFWVTTAFLKGRNCDRKYYVHCFNDIKKDLIAKDAAKTGCGSFSTERIQALLAEANAIVDILHSVTALRSLLGLPPLREAAAAEAPPVQPPEGSEDKAVANLCSTFDVSEEDLREFLRAKRARVAQ